MFFVGILGKAGPIRWKMKQKLEEHPQIQVEEFSSSNDLMAAVRQGRVSTMVIKVERFKKSHIKTMMGLYKALPCVAVLMVADMVSDELRAGFVELNLPASGILDLRFEMDEITRLIQRLGKSDEQVIRRHRRYNAFESVGVFYGDGSGGAGTLLNISAGGACLRFNGKPIQKGEAVEIKMSDGEVNEKVLPGKVVWTNPGSHLLGVQFDQALPSISDLYTQAA